MEREEDHVVLSGYKTKKPLKMSGFEAELHS
jgi:hypothetical protein